MKSLGADEGSITVREAVFRLLRSFGMTNIFGNPGSTELPMFRDFPSDFSYILALQEAAAVAMADGYAQSTRNAALVNLHSAAGVGHALGNLFTAYRNRAPIVVIAGQQARSMLPYQPFLHAERAAEFPMPYVKWSCEPARAEDVPAAIARAYYTAMQPPCGPTFVSVPVDDWDRLCAPIEPRQVSTQIRGASSMIQSVADALRACRRPAFVVGAEVAQEDCWDEMIELAERHAASVWVSPMSSRNSFPEDHGLFAGFLPACREKIVEHLVGSDLVVVFGAPVFTYHVEGIGPHHPVDSQLFQLTSDPNVAALAPAGTAIVTSMKPAIAELVGLSLPEQRTPPKIAARPNAPAARPLSDKYLLSRIDKLRPAGSVIVEEAPSSRGPMHDYLPIRDRDGFFTCASGGLGYGLPAAVGIALGRPGEKIIAILGDGSAMYSIQGLWSAARLTLPISFVIFNNRRYEAMLDFGAHFGLADVVGTDLGGLDFVDLARGHGITGVRVSDPDQLDAALSHSFASSQPTLVEVEIE